MARELGNKVKEGAATTAGVAPPDTYYVPLHTITHGWRRRLQLHGVPKLDRAVRWFSWTVTPNSIFTTDLVNKRGHLEVFMASRSHHPDAPPQLWLSGTQIRWLRDNQADRLNKASLEALAMTWDPMWETPSHNLVNLQRKTFESPQALLACRKVLRADSDAASSKSKALEAVPASSNPNSGELEPPVKRRKVERDPAALALSDQKEMARRRRDLELLRSTYADALQGARGAVLLSLDFETFELNHQCVTEAGWSLADIGGADKVRREVAHVVVQEHAHLRNKRYVADARDHFEFGRTITLPSSTLYGLLDALFTALSTTTPLFLIFHDPRADLAALQQLGFDRAMFSQTLDLYGPTSRNGIYIVDTQRLYSAWSGDIRQLRLSNSCKAVHLDPTEHLHNAGNDAHLTLALFERLMDRTKLPAPPPLKKKAAPL